MNTRLASPATAPWIWVLALMLSPAPIQSAPICVATCDLNVQSIESPGNLLRETVVSLKKLAPDVIILQQAANWQTCRRLAEALQPETYQVAICSSFQEPGATSLHGQAAILSRKNAYLAWSQAWQNRDGGFAFAAIRLADKNVGIFSVQAGDNGFSDSELARQIASLQTWKSNRLDAFIVAGNSHARLPDLHLEQIGFESALAGLRLEKGAVAESIFTRDAGLVTPEPTAQTSLPSAVCKMDLSAPKPAPAVLPQTRWWPPAILAAGIALFIFARNRGRRSHLQAAATRLEPDIAPALQHLPLVHIETEGSTLTQSQTCHPQSESVPVATPMPSAVREGVVANLTRWLKLKAVQRLLSDRAQLIAVQEAAALKVLAVDQRLTKIEQQIQLRDHEYEQRIDDLMRELNAAKEENRELIRAKIALVRAEMEKARRRTTEPQQY